MAIGDTVHVNDRMQRGYSYKLEAGMGRSFAEDFKPALTPAEMLQLGVFEGKYCNDCRDEFPASWFAHAKLSDTPDPSINCFGVKSRQPLSVWREKGWIIDPDSTVGGRVGSSMEIGFVTGSGSLDQESGLDLRLVDDASVPARDDTVVTWGSATGPYAPGVPIGTITEVYSSLREASQRAVVKPFVDFSSLDVVGVMVPSGSQSDRALIEADGTLK